MIIHGRTEISEIVYARLASDGGGAIRLSNIIRGPQVVFGGLSPDVSGWLTKATKQAIVGAFGQTNGKAVIKATNAYLNQLAATDPTKATALAGFINEDPMMVCSLGLEPEGVTMPIRWIHRTGLAYIDTEILVQAAYPFEMECDWEFYDYNRGAVLSNYDAANVGIGYEWQNRAIRHYFNGDKLHAGSFTTGTINHIKSTYNAQTGVIVSVIDGTTYNPSGAVQSGTATKSLLWFTDHRISTLVAETREANQRILANGIEHLYLPMLRSNNEIGVMDMASDGTFTFRKNAYTSGSFSLEYTKNGQPWTPNHPPTPPKARATQKSNAHITPV